jgi:hypothetical protein
MAVVALALVAVLVGAYSRAQVSHARHAPRGSIAGVPRIDATLKVRLRAIAEVGVQHGMRHDVFAKVGDSITESGSFLQDVGHGWFDLAEYASLEPTVAYFHRTSVDSSGSDSFARASSAATSGWTSGDAVDGSPDAVLREIDAIHPALALVMFGTNDIDRATLFEFEHNLARIVDECIGRGVIPVLSTIPDRSDTPLARDRVPIYNARIVALATSRQLPTMDLHAALATLPRHGLGDDGIHPSAFTNSSGDTRAADFGASALRSGYNVRNLLALLTLDKIRSIVFDDGAADR